MKFEMSAHLHLHLHHITVTCFSFQMLSVGCGAPVNMYQPHRVLLASCKLRLAHTLTMIASSLSCEGQGSSSATNDRGNLISSAVLACEEGLQLLKETAYGNPPLQAELKFHHGMLFYTSLLKESTDSVTIIYMAVHCSI